MQPFVSQGLGSWEPKDPVRWDLPLLCGADPAEILLPRPLQAWIRATDGPKDPVAEKTDRRGADRHRHSRRQSPEDKLSDQLAATLDLQPLREATEQPRCCRGTHDALECGEAPTRPRQGLPPPGEAQDADSSQHVSDSHDALGAVLRASYGSSCSASGRGLRWTGAPDTRKC